MTDSSTGFRFRLTFQHSSPNFFHFEEQSISVNLGDGTPFTLVARDGDTLAKATKFHIEGRGYSSEEAAIADGEKLRLRLRILNGLLGLGLTVPLVDSRASVLADEIKEQLCKDIGCVILDTIHGLAVIPDDPTHIEQVINGKALVYPSDPTYVLRALATIWPLETPLDERADDALQILSVATTELSPRAKFLTTYLALERLIDRLPRNEDAQNLIESLQIQVQKASLNEADKKSLVSSLSNLREQSFRTALLALVARINPPPRVFDIPARDFLSDCVDVRNRIAHRARLDSAVDLNRLSDGLRNFVMSLIWTLSRLPDLSVDVPPSAIELQSIDIRAI